MKNTTLTQQAPSQEEIANRAYLIWEQEGRQSGKEDEYWFRAISELSQSESHSTEINLPNPAQTTRSSAATTRSRSPRSQSSRTQTPKAKGKSPKNTMAKKSENPVKKSAAGPNKKSTTARAATRKSAKKS